LALLAQVVHCARQPDGSWAVGCRYNNIRGDLQPEPRQQLQTLMQLAPLDEPGAETNRQQILAALRTFCDNPLRDLLHSLKLPATCNGNREERMNHLYDLLLVTTNSLHLHRRAVKLGALIARAIEVVGAHAQGPPPRLASPCRRTPCR